MPAPTRLTNLLVATRLNVPSVSGGSVANQTGDLALDSTTGMLTFSSGGGSQLLRNLVPGMMFRQTSDLVVENTTDESELIGGGVGSGLTIPTGGFAVGRAIKGRLAGFYSSAASPGTIRFKYKIGSVVVLDTGAVTLPALQTNRMWVLEFSVTCRTTGSSGTFRGQAGVWLDASTGPVYLPMVNTADSVVNTTTGKATDAFVTFSVADASNSITCTDWEQWLA